ncbi:winged helix-turn-helix transcriptional regulator [Candidatus Woesearchaeota archaeon]|nr:winged helix-turn-helix transcriptional regulator [Candidatus Woesearchaeota archaeon]
MKYLSIILLSLIIIEIANAASLEGNIYDISLAKVKNSIVEINTIPLQRVVANSGYYEFKSIPKGGYQIKAYTSDKKVITEENITIEEDGAYTFDIFLIPELEEKESDTIWPYIIFPIIILIIVILLFLKYKKPKKEEIIDKDLDYILDIIKKEDNRIIQRDLVQKTGLSEAKISLMITDLESKGLVKKIRKGRANIIILNK